jgi:hypothetical protein
MSQNAEANMSVLKRLWTKIALFAESQEGIDDPSGGYIFSLGSGSISLNARWNTSKRNCIRALAAAGYSSRQKLKPRFTLIDRVLATERQLHDPASYR